MRVSSFGDHVIKHIVRDVYIRRPTSNTCWLPLLTLLNRSFRRKTDIQIRTEGNRRLVHEITFESLPSWLLFLTMHYLMLFFYPRNLRYSNRSSSQPLSACTCLVHSPYSLLSMLLTMRRLREAVPTLTTPLTMGCVPRSRKQTLPVTCVCTVFQTSKLLDNTSHKK